MLIHSGCFSAGKARKVAIVIILKGKQCYRSQERSMMGGGGCHSKDVFVKFTFNDVNYDGDPYPLFWEYEKKIEINYKKN